MNFYRNYHKEKIISKSNGRQVILAKPVTLDPHFPQVFVIKRTNDLSEIEIHKKLCELDSSILKLYHNWHDGHYYKMSLEYCEKGDLHSVLTEGVKYPFTFIVKKCYEIAKVVYLMHSNSLVHRDIKPLNIFINKDNEYKLADFGESKYLESHKPHSVKGTTNYFSPELRKRFAFGAIIESNPFRDDIWALGTTFFELTIGHLCELFKVRLDDTEDYLRTNLKDTMCPPWFCDLIVKMHSINPDNFIQIQEVLEQFKSNWDGSISYQGNNNSNYSSVDSGTTLSSIITIPECGLLISTSPSIYDEGSAVEKIDEPSEEENKCKLCKGLLTDEKIVLECGESFHIQCIKVLLNSILISAKNSNDLNCPNCFKKLSAESLASTHHIFDDYYKINSFMFAETKSNCKNCHFDNDVFFLSQDLMPMNYRCKKCKNKYCSFCTVVGGHRWSCDYFNQIKRSY